MESEEFASGEIWINNKNTCARFSPYICSHGIWLQNRANSWGGPHIDVNITPDRLTEILAKHENEIEISFAGPWIGKIDDLSGYAACDEGSHTRRILTMTLRIKRKSEQTRFEMMGETDYLDPKSVRSTGQVDLKSRGRYLFRVWFEILDENISRYFKDQIALEAMTAYIQTIKLDESLANK